MFNIIVCSMFANMRSFTAIKFSALTLWATGHCASLILNASAIVLPSSSPVPHGFPGFAINAVVLPEFAGAYIEVSGLGPLLVLISHRQ